MGGGRTTDAVAEGTAPGRGDAAGANSSAHGPPLHLSPSSAATFAQCPRRWRFRYVDRRPDPPGIAAVAGTVVHRVLERLLAEPPARRDVERARAIAAEEWPALRDHVDVVRLALDADGTRQFKWRVWLAVLGLWHLEDPGQVAVLATERRLDVQLGAVPFVGVLDRVELVDGAAVVSDYKSGRPPALAHVAEKLDQVLLYAAAWQAAGGEAPRQARLLYLGARSIEVDVTPAALDAAITRLHDRWSAIGACLTVGRFEARTGPLCGWCPYAAHCPEGVAELRRRHEAALLDERAPNLCLVA